MTFDAVIADFRRVVPSVQFWSLRLVEHRSDTLHMRQGRLLPALRRESRGAHITLVDRGGIAYGATSELDAAGLRSACERALPWLESSRRHPLFAASAIPRPQRSGSFRSDEAIPWDTWPLESKIELLADASRQLKRHERIVDWQAQLTARHSDVLLYTSDGIEIAQHFTFLAPAVAAVANRDAETQIRTGGGAGALVQGGLERLGPLRFPEDAARVAEEALALLDAPQCPDARTALLLTPSQMMLQIHESIGHPLELDRILGDERNFAGGSFVTPEMFGSYRYGSELLDVTFDPHVPGEAATCAFDDDGTLAERRYLIRAGILQRPLGGALSQARAGLPGVANARAADWNRPAIDRMGNLNLEPGTSTLSELVASVEHGVLMDTNRSWSIDDHRNKFQFGCELGRVIRDGELRGLVRNPNYRGISREFWRDLVGVGDRAGVEVWGTPNCGKGEPNQLIHVGHAAPPCLFRDVEVFGGE